mmetsp:Transcript_31551/g.73606  ORF Transcript_31551/g.73606 Transcript_31551/m.73606 type:complete len:130 (-) Transcript_31551:8-397(-)
MTLRNLLFLSAVLWTAEAAAPQEKPGRDRESQQAQPAHQEQDVGGFEALATDVQQKIFDMNEKLLAVAASSRRDLNILDGGDGFRTVSRSDNKVHAWLPKRYSELKAIADEDIECDSNFDDAARSLNFM